MNNENQSYIHLHPSANPDLNPNIIRVRSQEVPRNQSVYTILEDEKWAHQEVEDRNDFHECECIIQLMCASFT